MFGHILAKLRKEKNLSQYKLAELMNLSRGQIANYEQGSRKPDFEILEEFADFFDVSIDYLLGRTELRTYDERVFFDDVNHLAEKLATLEPEKRNLIVNTIDQLYLIINDSIEDERSLIILKKIITQLFFMKTGIDSFKLEKSLEIDNPVSVLEFMSNHKSEMNNLVDEFMKIHLEEIAKRKEKFTPPHESDDELI